MHIHAPPCSTTSKDNLNTWITSTMTAIIFSKEKSTARNGCFQTQPERKPTPVTSTEFYSIQSHSSTSLFILAIYYHWWNRWMSLFLFFFPKNFARWKVNFTGERSDGQKLTGKKASLNSQVKAEERMQSPLQYEHISYLLICWRQKGFLLFRNWTLVARWVSHTKLPRCQRYYFSPRVFVVVVWFFTPESKGQNSGFSRGKGWNSRFNGLENCRALSKRCCISRRFHLQILLHPQCQ